MCILISLKMTALRKILPGLYTNGIRFVFGTQRRIASTTLSDGPFNLFLGEKPINQAQHYKYLGVLIDADLNFKQHVDELLVEIFKRIGVLGRI